MVAQKIAFIGAGNMAFSLAGGLLARGHDPARLIAADPDTAQRKRVAELGIPTTADNAEASASADVVVLAVKPQLMRAVVKGIAATLRSDHLLISIAAGIPLSALAAWCGRPVAIVRCMPNTPALYGAGITALVGNERVDARQLETARSILAAVGETVLMDHERHLDAVTAVSGSGPAYVFYLLEAMIEAGCELGLPPETARELAAQTVLGAALMTRRSSVAVAELRRNVTSPGGTTERAIAVLDAAGGQDLLKEAVRQAAIRSRELGAEYGADTESE
jgi:pyrroline-5-carboxylate reductase